MKTKTHLLSAGILLATTLAGFSQPTITSLRLSGQAANASDVSHYLKSAKIYYCPADQSTVVTDKSLRRTRSYSSSWWLRSSATGDRWGSWGFDFWLAMRNRSSQILIPGPSSVFVFIEEHEKSIDDGMFGIAQADLKDTLTSNNDYGTIGPDAWAKLPADRHNQGANLSFADGHVVHKHWQAPKKFVRYAQPAAPGGDLQDFRYLESVVPRLR